MPTPIIIVSGKAGSGKDTAAAHIAQTFNGVTIALADPMKRFAKELVGFTTEQLWGPSAERNKVIPASELKVFNPMDSSHYGQRDQIMRDFLRDVGLPDGDLGHLRTWLRTYVTQAVDRDGGISARTVLQSLGTEWGRQQSPSMWINCALGRCRALVEGGYTYTREFGLKATPSAAYDYAIITDGRFRNEILGVRFADGAAFRIDRPNQEEMRAGIAGHRSEKELDGIPDHFYTDTIMNDSTIDDLYSRVEDAMAVQFGDVRE